MKKRVYAICGILSMALSFSACRQSPVLEQIVYVDESEQTDDSQSQLDPGKEGKASEEFEKKTQDDVDTQRQEEENQGTQGDRNQAASAANVKYNDHANVKDYSMSASEKQDGEKADQGSPSENDSKNTGKESASGSKESDGSEHSGTENSGTGQKDSESGENGQKDSEGELRQIVDARGVSVDLPEDVHSVTAVGSAAQLVEMIGGKGTLIGTDKGFHDSPVASAVCDDLDKVPVWWDGTGTDGMSDSSFQKLIAEHPDVCFYISGQNTFSDSQLKKLKEEDIAAFALYEPSSVSNLENSALLVGKVFGGAAESVAGDYVSWVEGVVDEVKQKCSGSKYSLYISSWDSSASYTLGDAHGILAEHSSGTGLAVAFSPKKKQILSSMMSVANVTNVSTAVSGHKSDDYVYVTPMFRNLKASVSGTGAVYYSGSGETGVAYDLFISKEVGSNYVQLGTSGYPAILVADDSVKSAIESNWFWKPKDHDGDGRVDEDATIYSGILGEYNIYVNPKGMGSWIDGSADSPLEAYWVACKLQDAYSMSEVKDKTKEFYKKFFGVSLSASQLETIYGE